MVVEGFSLVNDEKVRRVIEGTVTQQGKAMGGLGENADPIEVRAEYDKLGGLILFGDKKVKTGSFWDFERKAPRKEPDVIFEHRSKSGELFEYKGEANEPLLVKAEKEIAKAPKTLAGKKKGKKLQ